MRTERFKEFEGLRAPDHDRSKRPFERSCLLFDEISGCSHGKKREPDTLDTPVQPERNDWRLFLSPRRSRLLIERRELLAKLLKKHPENIKFSEELRGSREELLRVARQFQLEGLTAKRPNSLYESGRRSGAWVKIKLTQQQEFVIGGYTPPEGARKYFGSLLVGYYDQESILFAGRVGSGFSERALATLFESSHFVSSRDLSFRY